MVISSKPEIGCHSQVSKWDILGLDKCPGNWMEVHPETWRLNITSIAVWLVIKWAYYGPVWQWGTPLKLYLGTWWWNNGFLQRYHIFRQIRTNNDDFVGGSDIQHMGCSNWASMQAWYNSILWNIYMGCEPLLTWDPLRSRETPGTWTLSLASGVYCGMYIPSQQMQACAQDHHPALSCYNIYKTVYIPICTQYDL